jgi:hypothetical protein
MANPDKDFRLIRNKFEVKNEFSQERIRIGNRFVDDFIFDDNEAADIPINAFVLFSILFL